MTTRTQATAQLRKLGFEFDENVTGKIGFTWMATIDAIGRNSLFGDCRGIAVIDFTATASEFWSKCVHEAREHVRELMPCPHAPGECEFHDGQEE